MVSAPIGATRSYSTPIWRDSARMTSIRQSTTPVSYTHLRRISHHEFYGRLTRRMMPVLSEVDANDQVFRTDLRRRPDGDAGPLAWSLDALEHYLIGQGREWERYAWLKARLMPGQAFEGSDSAAQARRCV